MGSTDKTMRIILGVIILIVGYVYESWWGLIGLVPILTSIVSFCPFYLPFKISTLKSDKN